MRTLSVVIALMAVVVLTGGCSLGLWIAADVLPAAVGKLPSPPGPVLESPTAAELAASRARGVTE